MIRGLFVDFYGTLVHEDDIPIDQIISLIQEHAAPETTRKAIGRSWYEAFLDAWGHANGRDFVTQESLAISTLAKTLDAFGVDLDAREVIAPQLDHWNAPPLFPDTRKFLESVQSLGLPVIIVSNIDRSHIRAAMQLHNLSVEGVITSEDARAYKPHPAIFNVALERSGLSPSDVVHIGDSRTNDVEGARAAGIPVAWVNRTGKSSNEHSAPDYEVSTLDALVGILELNAANAWR